jgi:hypothetical protein
LFVWVADSSPEISRRSRSSDGDRARIRHRDGDGIEDIALGTAYATRHGGHTFHEATHRWSRRVTPRRAVAFAPPARAAPNYQAENGSRPWPARVAWHASRGRIRIRIVRFSPSHQQPHFAATRRRASRPKTLLGSRRVCGTNTSQVTRKTPENANPSLLFAGKASRLELLPEWSGTSFHIHG